MAKLRIQGKSANNAMNVGGSGTNVGPGPKSPKGLFIQGSSANYMGQSKSTSETPSPAAKPYPPTKPPPQNTSGRGSGAKTVLPPSRVK
jgi:hypothetical protein